MQTKANALSEAGRRERSAAYFCFDDADEGVDAGGHCEWPVSLHDLHSLAEERNLQHFSGLTVIGELDFAGAAKETLRMV